MFIASPFEHKHIVPCVCVSIEMKFVCFRCSISSIIRYFTFCHFAITKKAQKINFQKILNKKHKHDHYFNLKLSHISILSINSWKYHLNDFRHHVMVTLLSYDLNEIIMNHNKTNICKQPALNLMYCEALHCMKWFVW